VSGEFQIKPVAIPYFSAVDNIEEVVQLLNPKVAGLSITGV
jgi:hypothetical protein